MLLYKVDDVDIFKEQGRLCKLHVSIGGGMVYGFEFYLAEECVIPEKAEFINGELVQAVPCQETDVSQVDVDTIGEGVGISGGMVCQVEDLHAGLAVSGLSCPAFFIL